ncbi:MAG: DHH family phosphoesterase, partial [Bdellovibrionota bacterium]
MRDPSSLRDLDKAVERLITAFRNQEKICVYGDFDLDGSSGLALAVDALEKMGFEKVVFYQPKRLSEGYGLHNHAIEKFKEDSVDLILTVDVGITAIEEVEFANSLGIDVIITDHHLPRENLPSAIAVVNPNAGNCDSGLGHLCGAGVAYYLMLGLRRAMKDAN